jgi:hypothetical protein
MMKMIRTAVIALFLAFSTVSAAPVVAQDATQVAGQVADLGLAGLAGLMRRPQPVVHEDLNRAHTTTTRVDRNDVPRV